MTKRSEAAAPALLSTAWTAPRLFMHGVRVVELWPRSRCIPGGSHLKQEGSL